MTVGHAFERLAGQQKKPRLNKIIEYEPADLTMTSQAGITVADLNRRLGESGQMAPFGPALADTSIWNVAESTECCWSRLPMMAAAFLPNIFHAFSIVSTVSTQRVRIMAAGQVWDSLS